MPRRHHLRRRWRKRTGLDYPEQRNDASDHSALLNLFDVNEDSADKRAARHSLVMKFWVFPIVTVFFGGLFFLLIGRIADSASITTGFSTLFSFFSISEPLAARNMIWGVLEVLAGLFGITITVVAIIVQLSATRYTSRVVDLFLADRMNIFILFAYVMPLLYGFWLANSLQEGVSAFWAVGIFTAITTLVILMVIPYFQYVFHFLQPQSIIATIERATERHLIRGLDADHTIRARHEVFQSIRQLSDITLSSIERSDIVLATQCINSLKHIMLFYLERKARMPQAWFYIEQEQIAGMSEEVWRDIVKIRGWLELEVFKQLEIAFTSSLNKVRDINSIVARNLRDISERAATIDSEHTVEFFIKGFNTLIMFALNARDVRSVVHVLYQYRLLAESLLYRPNLVQRICQHMRYYGVNSQRRGVLFVIDAVAYDLRTLVEMAYEQFPETSREILTVLLSLDQVAESKVDVLMLRGVRKSQVLMAAFFIKRKRYDLVKDILKDMSAEAPQMLHWVQNDLTRVGTRDFWEIEDRGVSFYYVEEERRSSVSLFFAWLNKTTPLPAELQTLHETDTQSPVAEDSTLASSMLHAHVPPSPAVVRSPEAVDAPAPKPNGAPSALPAAQAIAPSPKTLTPTPKDSAPATSGATTPAPKDPVLAVGKATATPMQMAAPPATGHVPVPPRTALAKVPAANTPSAAMAASAASAASASVRRSNGALPVSPATRAASVPSHGQNPSAALGTPAASASVGRSGVLPVSPATRAASVPSHGQNPSAALGTPAASASVGRSGVLPVSPATRAASAPSPGRNPSAARASTPAASASMGHSDMLPVSPATRVTSAPSPGRNPSAARASTSTAPASMGRSDVLPVSPATRAAPVPSPGRNPSAARVSTSTAPASVRRPNGGLPVSPATRAASAPSLGRNPSAATAIPAAKAAPMGTAPSPQRAATTGTTVSTAKQS